MCVYCEEPRNDMHAQADRSISNCGSMRISETRVGMYRIIVNGWAGDVLYMESERISYCPFCGRTLRGEG